MRRGDATITVKSNGGIVEIIASMHGSESNLRLPPDLARNVAMQIMAEAERAENTFIDANPPALTGRKE